MSHETVDNNEAIEAWNTVLFEKFLRFRPLVSDALGFHGDRGIERLAPKPGMTIVDVGCGFGDTTLQLAERVGPTGHVTGVDAAAKFIELARTEAAGRSNVSYAVADVEASVPGGPYDAAFARMGTMFFASPVFALRNVRKVLRPGGTFCFVVWRKKEANDGFYNAEVVAREILGDPPKNDQVTCGPGPFSMASCDLVSDQLLAAGYTNISFQRSDGEILTGRNMEDAIEFAINLGPAGEVIRLAGAEGVARRAEIDAAMRKLIEPTIRPDGTVYAPSSCWIVTAQAPD